MVDLQMAVWGYPRGGDGLWKLEDDTWSVAGGCTVDDGGWKVKWWKVMAVGGKCWRLQ